MVKDKLQFSDTQIGYLINKTALCIKLVMLHEFKVKGYDITPEQWALLHTLNQENGQYQKQIADKLLKDRPNVTRIVDILEKKGLVIRKNDNNDRRIYKVFLTKKGQKLIDELSPIVQDIRNKVGKGLEDNEIKILEKALNKICQNLEKTLILQI